MGITKAGKHTIITYDNGNEHLLKEGTLLIDLDAKENYAKIQEIKKFSHMHGGFTFLRTENNLINLNPATVARLAFLSTYVGFENQLLFLPDEIPMLKKDLSTVLNISRPAANSFYDECIKAKMLIDREKNGLYISNIFFRGKSENSRTKIFKNTIQSLYRNTAVQDHKYLGYVIQIIPFINLEWNIVCENPEETNKKLIKPLTLKQICKILNYDDTHCTRLKQSLCKPWFMWKGTKYKLCKIVTDLDSTINTPYALIVNPHIICATTNYAHVENYEIFFNMGIEA